MCVCRFLYTLLNRHVRRGVLFIFGASGCGFVGEVDFRETLMCEAVKKISVTGRLNHLSKTKVCSAEGLRAI